MTYVTYSTRINLENLEPLIALCHFSVGARMLLESQPQHSINSRKERQDLLWFSFLKLDFPFKDYSTGRIFQKSGELRWEKEHGKFLVVYLGIEGDDLSINVEAIMRDYDPKHMQTLELLKISSEEKKYYLFGTRLEKDELKMIGAPAQEGDFAEARIHRLLRYPLDHEDTRGPIRFIVEELRDEATGQVVMFRFVGLDEGKKEAKAG